MSGDIGDHIEYLNQSKGDKEIMNDEFFTITKQLEDCAITFNETTEIVGTLKMFNGKFTFDGDADASAKKFIEFVQLNWDSKLSTLTQQVAEQAKTIKEQAERIDGFINFMGVVDQHCRGKGKYNSMSNMIAKKARELLTPHTDSTTESEEYL